MVNPNIMSQATRVIGARVPNASRAFSQSTRIDTFLNLGARAMSRENLYMSKQAGATGKNYIEHSPSLQLLQSERDLAEGRSQRENTSPRKAEARAAVSDVFNRDELARHTTEEDALLSKLGIKDELSLRIADLVERRVADETRTRLAASRLEHDKQTSDEVRRLTLEVEHLEQMRLLDSQRRSRNRVRYFAFTIAFLAGLSYASFDWTKEQRDQMREILEAGRIELQRRKVEAAPAIPIASNRPQLLLVEPVQPVAPIVDVTHSTPPNAASSWASSLSRFAYSLFWRQQ